MAWLCDSVYKSVACPYGSASERTELFCEETFCRNVRSCRAAHLENVKHKYDINSSSMVTYNKIRYPYEQPSGPLGVAAV